MTGSVVRARGFTLLELMMVVAIIALLGALAVSSYRLNILKGQAAQTLTDYGHIRTIVAVETQADGESNLQENSIPGAVPPKLQGQLDTREFNGPDGQQLQLVVAPAGTFASYPNQDVYALIDTVAGIAGELRLRVLRSELPHAEGDKLWISSSQLMFPLDPGSGTSATPVGPPAASSSGGSSSGSGSGSSSSGASTSSGSSASSSGTTGSGSGTSSSSGASTSSGGSATSSSTSGSSGASTSSGTSSPGTSSSSTPSSSSSSSSAGTSSSGTSSSTSSSSSGSTPPGAGGTTITGNGTSNGSTWTANVQICVGAAGGGPLTGYTNINVVFQVTTMYSTFQENLQISSTTGCLSKSYPGQPDGSNVQIQILNVINYTVSGTTSTPLWNGVKPSLTIPTPSS